MVDHIAALIHQIAVAVLADADIADGGGQLGKAQVQRQPALFGGTGHCADNGNDPRIISRKDRLNMGRADIALTQTAGGRQIKRKIAQDLLLRGAAVLRPAVQQRAVRIVGGDGGHLGPCRQERAQKRIPGLLCIVQMPHNDGDCALHRVYIIADGPHDLTDGLGAVGAGSLDNRIAVAAQKERCAERQHHDSHSGDQRCRQMGGARRAHHVRTSPAARARRKATGDVPLYFLKQ